ncbi:hypothetical protein [Pseudomonas batumici]|nr:hypothetical protein [Pseudomonas batumici]
MSENFAEICITRLSDIAELIEGLLNQGVLVSDEHLLFHEKGCRS